MTDDKIQRKNYFDFLRFVSVKIPSIFRMCVFLGYIEDIYTLLYKVRLSIYFCFYQSQKLNLQPFGIILKTSLIIMTLKINTYCWCFLFNKFVDFQNLLVPLQNLYIQFQELVIRYSHKTNIRKFWALGTSENIFQ